MKKILRPPRYLPEVLQAISELKETGGSYTNKIVDHVTAETRNKNIYARPRNLTTQIRRALNHAMSNGIVQQRAGKYRLNSKILDPLRDCAKCRKEARERRRRRKGRKHGKHGRKRRRRHHRQHSLTPTFKHRRFESDSDLDLYGYRPMYESVEDVPVYEARRRRKKRGKKHGRRRSRRRSGHRKSKEQAEVVPEEISTHEIDETLKKDPIYPDDHSGDGDDFSQAERSQCDNPDCLCNVKQETEEDTQNYDEPM